MRFGLAVESAEEGDPDVPEGVVERLELWIRVTLREVECCATDEPDHHDNRHYG